MGSRKKQQQQQQQTRSILISTPHSAHTRDRDDMANTGAVVAIMLHSGTRVMADRQYGGHRSTQWAKDITKMVPPSHPEAQPRGWASQHPRGQPRRHPRGWPSEDPTGQPHHINQYGSLHSTQWAHHDVSGSYHSTQWINTMPTVMAVTTVSSRPSKMLTDWVSKVSPGKVRPQEPDDMRYSHIPPSTLPPHPC